MPGFQKIWTKNFLTLIIVILVGLIALREFLDSQVATKKYKVKDYYQGGVQSNQMGTNGIPYVEAAAAPAADQAAAPPAAPPAAPAAAPAAPAARGADKASGDDGDDGGNAAAAAAAGDDKKQKDDNAQLTVNVQDQAPCLHCVPLPNSPKKGVQICVHPGSYLSTFLTRGKMYEPGLISKLTQTFEKYPTMQLVDIGANIGLYSIWAAALGRQVLAVEMLPENVMYIRTSVGLNCMGSQVTVVNNAIYRERKMFQPTFIKGNIGETLLDVNDMSKAHRNQLKRRIITSHPVVNVAGVLMDDLIEYINSSQPIYVKMDIEGSEHHAVAGAKYFFTQLPVKAVQMEWRNRNPDANTEILKLMTEYGYMPSSSPIEYVKVKETKNGIDPGDDVFFVRKS